MPMFELMLAPMMISDFVGTWPRRASRVLRKQRYDRGKGEGKLCVALFPLHLFSNTIVACQLNIHADKASRKSAVCVSCDRWSCSYGFPTLMVLR